MSKLLSLFPIVAALTLTACGDDGPVAEAVENTDNVAGVSANAGPSNSAAAEAADRAALPRVSGDLAWFVSDDGRAALYGPPASEPMLTIACAPGGVVLTRHHPAPADGAGTLSLSGAGHVASLPVIAVPTTLGPGEYEWRGRANGDMASALERPFSRPGEVEVSLGGAPSLVVPTGPEVRRLFATCLG